MRWRRSALVIIAALLAVGGVPFATPPTSAAESRCFAETGRCIRAGFLSYWQEHGGLARNGYPLSDEFNQTLEDGHEYTVQYFERVRLEYHPENADTSDAVLLGQFGRRAHPADAPVPQRADATYFDQTGHNVAGDFLAYWQANGGLAQFGYPLSEEIRARLEDGKTYTVQYFERARFERHPENQPPYDIELGQLGRQRFTAPDTSPPAALDPCTASTLQARRGEQQASAGTLFGGVLLTNVGTKSCTLDGYARFAAIDEQGQTHPTPQVDVPAQCSGPESTRSCPPLWAIVVQPGQVATISFVVHYVRQHGLPVPEPTTAILVTLPGTQGQFTLPAAPAPSASVGQPTQGDGSEPPPMEVQPFQLAESALAAVQLYYQVINERGYRFAYDHLLGPSLQAQQPFADFAAGYATTVHVTVATIAAVPSGPDQFTVTVRLAALQADGTVRRFRGTYEVAQVAAGGDAPPGTMVEQLVGASIAPE